MKAYLIAGEPSGDKLGAALMAGLKELAPGITFQGVGGPLMQAEGMASLFPMDELSVMGLVEILPKYRALVARINETAADVLAAKPDVLITIDSPDFCHRVARKVRAADPSIRIVHYVAPSVWAWRSGRAKMLKAHVDQVLALLPFEPPYFTGIGLRCDFVGHPIAAEPGEGATAQVALRDDFGLGTAPVLLVLPGSRRGEVSRLLPVFGEAVAKITAKRPDLRVVIPAAPGLANMIREQTDRWAAKPVILEDITQDQKRAAFALAEAAIAASGTVSLELAAARTPMVIAYDMNWLSWQIISRMVNLSTVTLVNLVTGRNTVPEYLGPNCKPDPIAEATLSLLDDAFRREAQLSAMAECMAELGAGGENPGLRAARAVLDGMGA